MRWTEAPLAIRDAVVAHLGPITSAHDITVGAGSDLAAIVTTSTGRAFIKGVCGISPRMRWLRNELSGNAAAGSLAPSVIFGADIDAEDGSPWLVIGTEHVDGRPVALQPGSPDLDAVGAVLERIASTPATAEIWPLARRWAPTDWWRRCAEHSPGEVSGWDITAMTRLCEPVPQLVDGKQLVHTDLHAEQILITPSGHIRVIDWGYPGAGAPWVDTALVTLRLIIAGHHRADAEAWAKTLPTFRDLDPDALTRFVVYLGGLWTDLAHTRPLPGSTRWALAARGWAAWRIERGTVLAAG
ncbi:MAG TPA: phosphotransferase [Actinokineospora sp.]|jgi:hypothetical protein|nr:phosphotransferase [Actinokineospora sp.]